MTHFTTRGGDKRVLDYLSKATVPVSKNEIKKALTAFLSAEAVNISLNSLTHKLLVTETNYKYKITTMGELKQKELADRPKASI